jgi:transposase
MSKRPRVLRSERKMIGPLMIVNPDAAGIDAGSEQHWVSVPEDRAEQPVRAFGTFTEDLYAMADWLVACGIKTVAIEATGVYWIPLFEVLEARGLCPRLVDSRSIGRRNKKKTDVVDCQWIRQLHSHGLLDGAFRPNAEMLPLRAYMRQRRMLIEYASDHIRHMQKALDLMNLKLHLVISDITGVSGLRIIHEILKGQTNPATLAALREPGCKNSEQTIAKALIGNYREEHLFALKQAVELYEAYGRKLEACDEKIATALAAFEKKADRTNLRSKAAKKRRKNQPHFDGRSLLFEMAGVDLTAIDGFEVSTVLTIISETGTDMTRWPTHDQFASWLALAPNRWKTGGKPMARKPPVIHPNRAAQAFRLAAQALERAKCGLGAFFRRIQSRHGRAAAIKATAHKLATIFYSMLRDRSQYRDPGVDYYEIRYQQKRLNLLKKQAAALGFSLTPIEEVH